MRKMVDRGIITSLTAITRTRASRAIWSSVLLTLTTGLLWWSSANWRAQAAAVTTLTLEAPADLTATMQDEQGKGVVIAGYEGAFDPQTKQLTIQGGREITRRLAEGRTLNSRVDPHQEVPRNAAYTFMVVNSTFLSTGDNAGNISGEIKLSNQSGATLYNTRLVFTRFRSCPATGTCDGNTAINPAFPDYYNDGMIPYQGKLHVSRGYGDIPASGNSSAVWTFRVTTMPTKFFFSFVVLSDWGVAAESVYPAAVQVNANSGSGVVIRGRGFCPPNGTCPPAALPAVTLLNAAGQAVTNLTNVATPGDTQINATVPAGTAAGIYSVRVTLAGGTAGGQGSSVINGRLTVTGVPSASLSGSVSSLSGTGPFLVTGNLSVAANLEVTAGTVFYVSNGARIEIPGGAALTAKGGVPGVPNSDEVAIPAQIVFTAQRSPGAGLPNAGAWGGVAILGNGSFCKMRNVVIEYGGTTATAGVFLTGSERELRFSDSIIRFSAGSGLAANGPNDQVTHFARNRIEYNGQSAATPAMLLSGNAALGLFEIPDASIPTGTNVSDAGFFYASGNDFTENTLNAIQIGTDGDANSNDFSRAGSRVLVGQGDTPLQIRGSNTNPAIVGLAAPSATELTIAPGALIQLAAGVDFQAGDYLSNRFGCIAANGFAGVNQVPGASLTNSRFIVFDRIGTGGKFGAIYFSRNSLTSCLLSFVQVRNGGESVRGRGAVLVEGANIGLNNTLVTGSATGGIIETQGGLGAGIGTTLTNNTSQIIDTIAGGTFGEGNLASDASVLSPVQIAVDTQQRGVFFIDNSISVPVLRFVNTTRSPVEIAGKTVAPGTMVTIAGGGLSLNDNAPGLATDLGIVTGIAVSNTGDRVYFIDSITPAIRFLNISAGSLATSSGITIERGNIGTLAQGTIGITITGLSVHPTNGDVYYCDASSAANKVFRISPSSGAPVLVAGSGGATGGEDRFEDEPSKAPTALRLLEPRAVAVTAAGSVFVADTGHNRVINVGTNPAQLVVQLPASRTPPSGSPYRLRPFPAGLALVGNQLYIGNRSAHNIIGTESPSNPADVAGVREISCDYFDSNCGDDGPRTTSQFKFFDTGNVGMAGDANGIFICDQPNTQGLRGRIRYVNLSNNSVEVAGKTILSNHVTTVFGNGLGKPFDGALASSALLSAPSGVALDPLNNGLWITDSGSLRFVNRSPKPVTIFAGTASALTVQPGRIATANAQAGEAEAIDGVQIKFGGFDTSQGLWVTTQGIYIADTRGGPGLQGTTTNIVNRRTSRIRFVNTSNQSITFYPNGVTPITVAPGVIRTIAGGNPDAVKSAQDGFDPLEARLVGALDVAVHPTSEDLYICEAGNKRVRRVNRMTGEIRSIPANFLPGATDPGVTNNAVNAYSGLTFDAQGRLWVVDAGANAILREKTAGSAFTTGFDTLISGSPLRSPRDVAVDSTGTFAYVTNAGPLTPGVGEHRVMRLTINGNTATAATLAGQAQVKGYSGDYGPPGSALLNLQAAGIVVTVQGGAGVITVVPAMNIIIGVNGEIIFTDTANNAIRRIR